MVAKVKNGLYIDSIGDIAFVRGGTYDWVRLGEELLDISLEEYLPYSAEHLIAKPISKDLNTW